MDEYIIRPAKEAEFDTAMELAFRVFLKFEAQEYGREGTDSFAEFLTSPDLKKLFLTRHYLVYVALDGDKIIGVTSLRSGNHISLLFVDPKYHRRGIARRLILAEAQYLANHSEYDYMTVNSSPYAEEFYHRLGFKDTGVRTNESGIIYTPMQLQLV